VAAGCCLAVLLSGCGDPDRKLRQAAAQSARAAASEVAMTQLVVEQLREHRLWQQPADQMVADAEKSIEKAVGSFTAQQPSTPESRRLYDEVGTALDDAQKAVTATRIALGQQDLAAATREVAVLKKSGETLEQIGELAR
jgi:hypothetical protein